MMVCDKWISKLLKLVPDKTLVEALQILWDDRLVNYPEMCGLLWEYKISPQKIRNFELKKLLLGAALTTDLTDYIEDGYGVDFRVASRVAYSVYRSYVNDDDLVEMLNGMHEGIFKGELDSHVVA